MKNVLLVGCATGIGFELLKKLLDGNHQIFAADIKPISQNHPLLKTFITDIANQESINNLQNYFKEQQIKLDLIINAAGIYQMASLVESNFFEIEKLININLKGVMCLINKTHQFLKEKGKIIIITSEVASFDPLPFNGLYSISKIALENYAQSLRQELNLLNQKVITIRPGAVATPLQEGSLKAIKNFANETKLYQKEANKFLTISKKFMGKPLKPSIVAKKIYQISLKKHPKTIYKIHQNIGLVLLNILPKKIQCMIIKTLLK